MYPTCVPQKKLSLVVISCGKYNSGKWEIQKEFLTNPCPDVETGFVSEWKHFVVDCIVVSMNTLNKTTLLLSDAFDVIVWCFWCDNHEYGILFFVHCSLFNIQHLSFSLNVYSETSERKWYYGNIIKSDQVQQSDNNLLATVARWHQNPRVICIQHIIQRKRKIQTKERQKYTNAKILLHTKFRYDKVS